MTEFKKKNIIEKAKLNVEEISEYYMNLRKYNYDNNIPLKGIEIRKKLHYLVSYILKIDRILSKEKLITIEDNRIKNNKPKIYACTHIGGKDAERICEGLNDYGYFLSGDPGQLYKELAGLLLFLKGTVDIELQNKTDRYIATKRCIELLQRGGNLIIFPEGAWNITDSMPTMKLFPGAVKIALETGAEIIPVALEQDNKNFYISLGKNISYEKETNADKKRIAELTNELRDELSTLKWTIWEHIYPDIIPRESITEDYAYKFHQDIDNKFDHGYTKENIMRDKYQDKNNPDRETAYAFTKKLVPSKKNAFILRELSKEINNK